DIPICTRLHITRLEALKLQIQQHVEILYGNELDGIDKLMRDIYTSGYYHTAINVQQGVNVGWSLMSLDTNRINKIISKPWATD
ncbi:phage head morphogenesis protein, partial [Clostridioides difficile]|nr:phage head morphogenesis protein [Clostridioides difficile]